jgi:hypothetical protein
LKDFEKKNWGAGGVEGMVIHELGHIIDNRSKETGIFPAVISGGGLADKLIRFVGEAPSNPVRFMGEVQENEYLFRKPYEYGNNSSADYFANAFMCNVLKVTGTMWGMAEWWTEIQLQNIP